MCYHAPHPGRWAGVAILFSLVGLFPPPLPQGKNRRHFPIPRPSHVTQISHFVYKNRHSPPRPTLLIPLRTILVQATPHSQAWRTYVNGFTSIRTNFCPNRKWGRVGHSFCLVSSVIRSWLVVDSFRHPNTFPPSPAPYRRWNFIVNPEFASLIAWQYTHCGPVVNCVRFQVIKQIKGHCFE